MGILVQREFSVANDDRIEFERQSRLGVWENMRYNGAQMIAYGGWAFGGDGEFVVTHSVYEDFAHWTATRPWGEFSTEAARIEETRSIRQVFAGRPRLVRNSRATLIEYDSMVSAPTAKWRKVGEPLAAIPPSFGRQSVVAETRFNPTDTAAFFAQTVEGLWPWYTRKGARPLIYGWDPLGPPNNIITYIAFPDISDYEACWRPDPDVADVWAARDRNSPDQSTRLLMISTDYGANGK
ncbi:MAG: hypothetical protein ACFHX7_04280 [Pseudomonadota bacterium]